MNFVSKQFHKFHTFYSVLAGTSFIMAKATTTSDYTSGCHRLLSVPGDKAKQNDVIVCGSVLSAKQHVIFFGGDVQDYEENMKLHSPKFIRWNLETTASILHNRFKDSCVFVMKPSRMFRRSLSIYQNFLNFNTEGNPEFSSNSGCLMHCLQLYYSAVDRMKKIEKGRQNNNEEQCSMNGNQDECQISYHPPIILMAFSKGCVVLNQMVFELKRNKDEDTVKEFLSRLSDFYWLDSGHNGGSKTWVTDDDPLKELAKLNVKINVHVTPYQVNDTGRPWIGKEQRKFVDKLKLFGANVMEKKHFAQEMPSLDNHFKLLECDYVERMNTNNPAHSSWNVESTAQIISSKFTDSVVFVVKSSKMLLNIFNLYTNFLLLDEDSLPEYTEKFGALSHLHSLYKEAKYRMIQIELNSDSVGSCLATNTQEDGIYQATGNQGEKHCLATRSGESDINEHPVLNSDFPIKLVGFSKGGSVLNQLIHEIDHSKDDKILKGFLSNISEIYWLDSGNHGGKGAYITDDEKLKDLKSLGCKIIVHVTPYQINDPMRKWIEEEEELFVDKLKELKADITEYRHFMDEQGQLENHFKVLTLI